MVPLEEGKRQFDQDLLYKKDALKKGIAVQNRQLDNEEPGWWSMLGEGASLFNDLSSLFS
jgi:hypothetical protein